MHHMSPFTAIVFAFGCASASGKPAAVASQPAAVPPSAPAVNLYAPAVNLFARIPAQIGAFKLTERAAVRGAPADSLFRYKDGSPANLSVFIYDADADRQNDADPQLRTAREGEKFKAVQDILMSRGQIAAHRVAFSDTTRLTVGTGTLLEHAIGLGTRHPNGAITVELQYLYLIGGKFVKVRATIPEKGWEQANVPQFARELALHMAGPT
jgi:hypothetical protein